MQESFFSRSVWHVSVQMQKGFADSRHVLCTYFYDTQKRSCGVVPKFLFAIRRYKMFCATALAVSRRPGNVDACVRSQAGTCGICVVHSCQQKSIDLKFSKSQPGNDVRYSFHHNSSRFTFPIFAHSCRFSLLHSLNQSHRAYINRRRQYICLI